jgi:hypothetical protein
MNMALKDGSEHYTNVCLMENGKPTWRRMHQLTVQTWDGRTYTFEKDRLPGMFVLNTGESHKGSHLGELLGIPRETVPTSLKGFIPGPRDWVYVIVGVVLVILFKATLILASTPY